MIVFLLDVIYVTNTFKKKKKTVFTLRKTANPVRADHILALAYTKASARPSVWGDAEDLVCISIRSQEHIGLPSAPPLHRMEER